MRHHAFVVSVVLAAAGLCALAVADPTGMYVASGGNLSVIDDHPTVALRHETISFVIGYSGARVQVDLQFENTGGAQEVLMGFPEVPGMGKIWDLACQADGETLATTTAGPERLSPDSRVAELIRRGKWYLFNVPFAAGQKRELRITYNQQHATGYGRPALRYYLQTGANWQGNVDWVEIRARYVDRDNWSVLSVGSFAQGVRGQAIYRIEDYDGHPGNFTVTGSPQPASLRGLSGSGPREAGERVLIRQGDRWLVTTSALADVTGSRVTDSAEGARVQVEMMPALAPDEITDPSGLAGDIMATDNAIGHYLYGYTSQTVRQRIQELRGDEVRRAELQGVLAGVLNRWLYGQGLLNVARSREGGDLVSSALREELNRMPAAYRLAEINRELLGRCFPGRLRAGSASPPTEVVIPLVTAPSFAEAFATDAPTVAPGAWVDLQTACDSLGLALKVDQYEGSTTVSVSRANVPG